MLAAQTTPMDTSNKENASEPTMAKVPAPAPAPASASASAKRPAADVTPNTEELQYLGLIRDIMSRGENRKDRTGTGTRALFAPPQMRFSLADNILPLLTTKRTFLRPVFEELMWFIRAETDSKLLTAKNVRIWDKNGSREFLDKVGLMANREGDLGPVYGFQWRHFGAKYVDCDTDYTGQGYDQLREILRLIKEDPTNRRILMSAWNPADLDKVALPPCHMFCQFFVSGLESGKLEDRTLSCQLYQRSCDMGLGVPFNIASYSMLTIMIADCLGMKAGEFVHCLGDAHIYNDHIDALKTQLEREPRPFPQILLKKEKQLPEGTVLSVDEALKRLESFEYTDFEVIGYNPHKKIEMNMSA